MGGARGERARERREKERGRGRRRTFGCGKMPSAHSLKRPRPAFQRLCTCKCLLEDFAHRSVNVFSSLLLHPWLIFCEHLIFNLRYHSTTVFIAPFSGFAARACTWRGSCSTTLSCHSVPAGGITALACKRTRLPTFKRKTHPEETGLNTQSQVLSEGAMKEGVFSPKDMFGTKDIPCKVQDYLH